jgi:hypothetical protein
MLFKEVSYPVSKLVEDIHLGELALPDIQRPFVWANAKVRDLFDSMYQGFPVGYLLLWGNATDPGARQIGPDGKQAAPRLLIIDGQQRLTSLYAVLKQQPVLDEDYRSRPIKVAFRPRDRLFRIPDAAVERDPEYIPDVSALWSDPDNQSGFTRTFLTRLKSAREVTDAEEDDLRDAIGRLHALQSYRFTALELSSDIDEEKVAEVFVRINSKGVSLNQADFILTLMSVWWDDGRAALERFCRTSRRPSRGEASPFNHFIQPDPDQMLRVSVGLGFRRGQLRTVYALLRGRDVDSEAATPERRDELFAVMRDAQTCALDLTNWHEFLKVLIRAGYRSESMISSKNAVLYAYILFLVGKRDFAVPLETLRDVIARWFFMAALTGRYSSSPESQIESDLARLRELDHADDFQRALDEVVDDTLTADYWQITLPNALATQSARSPSLFAYYAALNLLDARVLLSRMRVSELLDPAVRAKRAALERHHLFPRAYLRSIGVESMAQINQIANYAFVEWPKNTAISDQAPAAYWPAFAASFDTDELERMCAWHALPPDWHSLPYDAFLAARRRLIADVVHAGFKRLRDPSLLSTTGAQR